MKKINQWGNLYDNPMTGRDLTGRICLGPTKSMFFVNIDPQK